MVPSQIWRESAADDICGGALLRSFCSSSVCSCFPCGDGIACGAAVEEVLKGPGPAQSSGSAGPWAIVGLGLPGCHSQPGPAICVGWGVVVFVATIVFLLPLCGSRCLCGYRGLSEEGHIVGEFGIAAWVPAHDWLDPCWSWQFRTRTPLSFRGCVCSAAWVPSA